MLQRLDGAPEDRDLASPEAALRRRRVEDGLAEDERRRGAERCVEEARDVLRIVLSVGVDLERVGRARRVRRLEAGHDRGAFAAVFGAEVDLGEAALAESFGDGSRAWTAAVVDDDHVRRRARARHPP